MDNVAAIAIVLGAPFAWVLLACLLYFAWPDEPVYEWQLHLMFWPAMLGVFALAWIGWWARQIKGEPPIPPAKVRKHGR